MISSNGTWYYVSEIFKESINRNILWYTIYVNVTMFSNTRCVVFFPLPTSIAITFYSTYVQILVLYKISVLFLIVDDYSSGHLTSNVITTDLRITVANPFVRALSDLEFWILFKNPPSVRYIIYVVYLCMYVGMFNTGLCYMINIYIYNIYVIHNDS